MREIHKMYIDDIIRHLINFFGGTTKHIYRAENVAQLAGYVPNIQEALGLILSTIGQKQKTCYL